MVKYCSNVKCSNIRGLKEESCPKCGAQSVNLGMVKGMQMINDKKKYQKEPKKINTAICVKCEKEYQLESYEKPSDFQCECGGELSTKRIKTDKINSKNPRKPPKPWKNQTKGVKVLSILIVLVLVVGIIYGISGMFSTATPQTSGVLTADSVNSTLGGDSRINTITVQGGAVTINYELGFVNDDNDILLKTSEDAIDFMKTLFKDNRVTSVTVVSSGTFTDQNGNDNVKNAISITVDRATADKSSWDGVNDRLSSDPADLLEISNSYSIYPSVYSKLTSVSVPISK